MRSPFFSLSNKTKDAILRLSVQRASVKLVFELWHVELNFIAIFLQWNFHDAMIKTRSDGGRGDGSTHRLSWIAEKNTARSANKFVKRRFQRFGKISTTVDLRSGHQVTVSDLTSISALWQGFVKRDVLPKCTVSNGVTWLETHRFWGDHLFLWQVCFRFLRSVT